MRLRVLGTAAGGGLPQWNCACPSCVDASAGGTGRTQDCLAISGDGTAWYLVNASPDLRTQVLSTPELAPPAGTRDTPLGGVLFTSAELDHTLGLLSLRGAAHLDLYATAPVRRALRSAFSFLDAYGAPDWHTVGGGRPVDLAGALTAEAIPVSAKQPRYAAPTGEPDWVVAYRFTDPAGASVVYAPGLAALPPSLVDTMSGADLVLLDGTFYTADEMPGAGALGHLSIVDTLPLVAAHRGPTYLYTHLNNTNPLGDPRAPQHAVLAAAGARVASDGERWTR